MEENPILDPIATILRSAEFASPVSGTSPERSLGAFLAHLAAEGLRNPGKLTVNQVKLLAAALLGQAGSRASRDVRWRYERLVAPAMAFEVSEFFPIGMSPPEQYGGRAANQELTSPFTNVMSTFASETGVDAAHDPATKLLAAVATVERVADEVRQQLQVGTELLFTANSRLVESEERLKRRLAELETRQAFHAPPGPSWGGRFDFHSVLVAPERSEEPPEAGRVGEPRTARLSDGTSEAEQPTPETEMGNPRASFADLITQLLAQSRAGRFADAEWIAELAHAAERREAETTAAATRILADADLRADKLAELLFQAEHRGAELAKSADRLTNFAETVDRRHAEAIASGERLADLLRDAESDRARASDHLRQIMQLVSSLEARLTSAEPPKAAMHRVAAQKKHAGLTPGRKLAISAAAGLTPAAGVVGVGLATGQAMIAIAVMTALLFGGVTSVLLGEQAAQR